MHAPRKEIDIDNDLKRTDAILLSFKVNELANIIPLHVWEDCRRLQRCGREWGFT